jgi:chromosome segregation ATPase
MSHELTVVPKPSLSLYQREEEWSALIEFLGSEEGQSTQSDEVFLQDLREKWLALEEKRDSFAAFMAWMRNQIDFGKAERQRIAARETSLEAKYAWLEGEIIKILRSFGQTEKGAWKKLEGRTSTLQLNKNPASVEIVDAEAVPVKYKSGELSLAFKMESAKSVGDALARVAGHLTYLSSTTVSIDKKALLEYLKGTDPCERCRQLGVVNDEDEHSLTFGMMAVCPECKGAKVLRRTVPGARLKDDSVRLVRK